MQVVSDDYYEPKRTSQQITVKTVTFTEVELSNNKLLLNDISDENSGEFQWLIWRTYHKNTNLCS